MEIQNKKAKGFATIGKPIPPLLVPKDNPSLFPKFIQGQKWEWQGKTFADFSPELQKKFQRHVLAVVIINGDDDETRDMFIRLQGGSALTKQEVRDAWPGDFCDFVLETGGKESQEREGHKFFDHRAVFRRPSPDRGEVRQLVAQIFMLFLYRKIQGNETAFRAIGAEQLDEYYLSCATMGAEEQEAKNRFHEILDELHYCFRNVEFRRKIKNDDVIHLILYLDSILDAPTPWREEFASAFKEWEGRVNEARELIKKGALTIPQKLSPAVKFLAAKGPAEDKIRTRHEVFEEQMRGLLRDRGCLRTVSGE